MTALEEYEKAMREFDVPQVPLEVYDSCSWRRVGIRGDYKTVMYPCNSRSDGHPDIAGGHVLRALVAAFNAMLEQRQQFRDRGDV